MRTGLVALIFLVLLLVRCAVYPGIGTRFITPQTVLQVFLHFDPQNFGHNVIIRFRLPRSTAALLAGVSFGVAGALLQIVIHNPLREPRILGLNAGAALVVVATSAFGLAFPVRRSLLASTRGALLFLLVLLFSFAGRLGLTPMKVTLCGVALSTFMSSITAAILILDEQTLLAMRAQLAGDLAGQDWAMLGTPTWFSLGGFMLAPHLASSLSMLALGDHMVQGLGVSALRTRTFTLLTVALLCGAAVSIAGPIGFVSLLVPQIVRRLVPAGLRVLLPLSACIGTLSLLLAGIIARTFFTPRELTAGVVTASAGAPAFAIMAIGMSK